MISQNSTSYDVQNFILNLCTENGLEFDKINSLLEIYKRKVRSETNSAILERFTGNLGFQNSEDERFINHHLDKLKEKNNKLSIKVYFYSDSYAYSEPREYLVDDYSEDEVIKVKTKVKEQLINDRSKCTKLVQKQSFWAKLLFQNNESDSSKGYTEKFKHRISLL